MRCRIGFRELVGGRALAVLNALHGVVRDLKLEASRREVSHEHCGSGGITAAVWQ